MISTPLKAPQTGLRPKLTHIEVLRILAVFLVIFNHTRDDGFFLFSTYDASYIGYWVYMFASVFCKVAVPLFLAISGALLIPRDESTEKLYGKRVLRMVFVLVLISVIYYLYNNRDDLSAISVKEYFEILFTDRHASHLGYLYYFIPYLMGLPLLRILVRHMENRHFLYMFLCALFFTAVLPVAEYLMWQGEHGFNTSFRMAWITSNIVIYPTIGYYIEYKLDVNKLKVKQIAGLWIVNLLCIGISCAMTYYRAKHTGVCTESDSQVFHNSFVIVNLFTIYVTAKYLHHTHPIKGFWQKTAISAGSCTFGIYLIHLIIRDGLAPLLEVLQNALPFLPLIVVLLYCLAVFLVGYLIIWLIKKIPFVNKFI